MLLTSIFLFETVFAAAWAASGKDADQSNFLWIKKSRSAQVLDNFKELQQVLLFENVPVSSEDENLIFNSDNKTKALESILKRVEERKDTLKERKKNVTRKKFDLKRALADLDSSIANTEQSIKDTENEISNKNRKIAELSSKIIELDEKIIQSKKTILNYLTYIYSKWEWMYSEDNNIDVVRSIVLNDGDIWDLLSDMHFKTLLELSGQNLVELHRDLVKEYYFNKEEAKREKLESIRLKNDLKVKNEELITQKEYKEQLLKITKWQEALFNKFILEKQQSENDIKNKLDNIETSYADIFNNIWNKYDCDLKFMTWWMVSDNLDLTGSTDDTVKCKQIKKYFELEKRLREDDSVDFDSPNPLSWMAEPARWISTFFHDEDYYSQLWSEHEAIDIRFSQWTDLKAPAPWYVYFVRPPVKWGYAYIALKHADWFVTVYWHVSQVLVNQFDFVEAWQVFAVSGWAPGTPWAGPMTSWAHLHFEVFKDRENVDPLRYFDLTHLKFDDLELKYRYKYVEDLKLKYWNKINMDRFQKFFIAWDSEIERQKYLLNNYASDKFNNWDLWTEEALNWQIDPSFMICVWLAETWLWRHLKTWYNVWNIWNTDSGWTYDFDSPRDWIYWMSKTLNNRYLRKYRSIDMLSRWWNKDWAIYASSSKNWHNNVVKCLSALKWRFVEDDYKFRIYDMDE
ncbi:MAG: Peptidase family M23 [uncultured bacterium (gcode 4)]|uniref:Peptidase family M23 n=1 Tax=uncultured bacterium (gcode 4) TaxID=1234023 RepID=K2FX46_9BACT|nr:MAG: Peptidase family M23 [uncultured bacterium (gcode 4)]